MALLDALLPWLARLVARVSILPVPLRQQCHTPARLRSLCSRVPTHASGIRQQVCCACPYVRVLQSLAEASAELSWHVRRVLPILHQAAELRALQRVQQSVSNTAVSRSRPVVGTTSACMGGCILTLPPILHPFGTLNAVAV